MKKIYLLLLALVCLVFGFLRIYDLLNFTDLEGFVEVSTASARYLLLLIPIVLIFLYAKYYGTTIVVGFNVSPIALSMILVGMVHIFCGIFSLLFTIGLNASTITFVLIASMLFTGLWLLICGIASLSAKEVLGGSAFFAFIANIFYYILMLDRYLSLVASSQRISHIVAILVPMSVVLFFSAFAKQIFFVSRTNKLLIFSGILCFLVAGCLGFAEVYYAIENGTVNAIPLMQYICSVSMGVFGLICSLAMNKSQIRKVAIY